MLEEALKYQKKGFSVIPLHSIANDACTCNKKEKCESPGKHPRLQSWKEYQERKATEDEIREWWRRWPQANIGIVTGAVSGLFVLDVDEPKGTDELQKRKLTPGLGVRCQTGSGGWHYYYRHPGGMIKNLAGAFTNVDLRGDGGLVVAPPSSHINGQKYEWILSPFSAEISTAPPWLMEMIGGGGTNEKTTNIGGACPTGRREGKSKNAPDWMNEILMGVGEGQRNAAAAKLAGAYLRESKGDKVKVLMILRGWNTRNRPPLGDDELLKVVESIAGRQGAAELGESIGLGIKKIIFLKSSDGEGRFEFFLEKVEQSVIFSPADLITNSRFRTKFLGASGLMLPPMKNEVYVPLMQKAIEQAEIKEVTQDTTNQELLIEMIRQRLVHPEKTKKGINRGIVVECDTIFLKLYVLMKILREENIEQINKKEVVKILEDIGFKPSRYRDEENIQHRIWELSGGIPD